MYIKLFVRIDHRNITHLYNFLAFYYANPGKIGLKVYTCRILVSLPFGPSAVMNYCTGPKKERNKFATSMNFEHIFVQKIIDNHKKSYKQIFPQNRNLTHFFDTFC